MPPIAITPCPTWMPDPANVCGASTKLTAVLSLVPTGVDTCLTYHGNMGAAEDLPSTTARSSRLYIRVIISALRFDTLFQTGVNAHEFDALEIFSTYDSADHSEELAVRATGAYGGGGLRLRVGTDANTGVLVQRYMYILHVHVRCSHVPLSCEWVPLVRTVVTVLHTST